MILLELLSRSLQISITGLVMIFVTALIGFYLSGQYKKCTLRSQYKTMYDCTKEQVFSSPLVAFFQYYILDMNGGKIYYNINDYGYLYLLISPLIWLLTIDTLTYWIHRTLHCHPFYKPIHHLHHTYYPVTTFTATGATVGEAIILGVIPLNLLFLIYPFHINFYYFVFIYQLIWFTTSHIDISYNAPGILISPHDHNMHHKYINKNFGVHTCMWDIICDTIYRPKMES